MEVVKYDSYKDGDAEYCNGIYNFQKCEHIQFNYGELDWCCFYNVELQKRKSGSMISLKCNKCKQ